MTYKVSKSVSIPVIGIGGIMSTEDALQYFLAGASAIQIGTTNFIDPAISKTILTGIKDYCKQENITCITDFHQLLRS